MKRPTAGELRNQIGIHSGKQIVQENGETATIYDDKPDRYIWAKITPVNGKPDVLDDNGEIIETTHKFYVRALSLRDVKPDMFFTYRGQRYDILSYTSYYKEPGWLELSCVLVIERGEPVQTEKLESSGGLKEKDLRFQTFCNYWNCYCFDGTRKFDGSLLFDKRRGGLSLAQTNVKINAVMPHRVYPSKISVGVLSFRTDEKVFAILDCGRTVFDNMGEFIRLNGDKTLDGSWQLWQRARSAIYKDFQITETVREKKKLFAVATVITVVQHTPILFQKAKLETSVLLFAPIKETLASRTIFLSKVKESISSDICKIFFFGFSMRNRESVSIIEKYFHKFQEKKDFLSRQLSIFISLTELSGSGNAELFAGIFEVLNVTETLGFYQNWRVINRNLSPVLSPVSVETNEKIFNDTAIQNIKNVTFSPYSICNNSTFDVKVAITTVRPSRADGTYRLDGTLRFDGKALPQTETL